MASTRIFPVVMSGGSGTRLWPLSTDRRPKQFHALGAGRSMIEETVLRLEGRHGDIEFLAPIVIAGEGHRAIVAERLSAAGVEPAAVVLEPMGRNTAATAALAALAAEELDPDALVLLMPADHVVGDSDAFLAAIKIAAPFARSHIVTFGIDHEGQPSDAYGYIKQHAKPLAKGIHPVVRFEEKPEVAIAQDYIEEGGYTWNSGVFFFAPDVMLAEFEHAAADIRDGARAAYRAGRRDGSEILLDADLFKDVRNKPVDKAVMEQTRRAAVVPVSMGWADIGSWDELWRLSDKDKAGNVAVGSVTLEEASGNLIRAEGVHISAVGVSGLIIVATPEAVLILPRGRSQEVKRLIPAKSGGAKKAGPNKSKKR